MGKKIFLSDLKKDIWNICIMVLSYYVKICGNRVFMVRN